MSSNQKTYQLSHRGNLFWVKARVGGKGVKPLVVPLLVDTGSSYTIMPLHVLQRVGCDTENPLRREEIITGQGKIYAPVVRIAWLNCVGQLVENFPVVGHTIPGGLRVSGLLGMDFLTHCRAVISVGDAEIRFTGNKFRGEWRESY